jgi:hypothetical protein
MLSLNHRKISLEGITIEEKVKPSIESKTVIKSDSDESTPVWAMGLAAFVMFGLPIIIIVLIIWKIKQRRKKKF